MILGLPKGYETEIGDGGAFLSGGQRQRIALARALFGDPKLVILDEPNSNLDQEGENALIAALGDAKQKGTTIVLVSHRLTMMRVVDVIGLMRNGTLETVGPARRDAAPAAGRPPRLAQPPAPVAELPSRAEPSDNEPRRHLGAAAPHRCARSRLRAIAVAALFVGAFGAWASYAPLASAAIASGVVSPESSRKTIQHLEGGIVEEILVKEGDRVEAGAVLMRLAPTQARANFAARQRQVQSLRGGAAPAAGARAGGDGARFSRRA